MPLIRRDHTSAPSDTSAEDLGPAALKNPDADIRWRAARALGDNAEAADHLAAALGGERDPKVREAIHTSLVRIGSAASAGVLVPYLRSDDAAERAAAIDALQAMPDAALPHLPALLADPDSDVRLLAAEIARTIGAGDATRLLSRVLEEDPHPNVCAAAVEVLAENGTADALPALRRCADRFATDAFLPFAIKVAIERISASGG